MLRSGHSCICDTPEATSKLANLMAARLRTGDCLLLDGPIGAGKTHFARALLHSVLTTPEDVPSPTFTLVQTYDTTLGEIWHADLYRVNSADELVEIGLIDAFDTAICLIEWPDRMGDTAPPGALTLEINPTEQDKRVMSFRWSMGDWGTRLKGLGNA